MTNILGLTTISWLINQIITYGVIAAVVIFSPEIRTGLERLGRGDNFFSTTQIGAEENDSSNMSKSVEYMSPRRLVLWLLFNGVRTLQEPTSRQEFPWMQNFGRTPHQYFYSQHSST